MNHSADLIVLKWGANSFWQEKEQLMAATAGLRGASSADPGAGLQVRRVMSVLRFHSWDSETLFLFIT